MRVCDRHPRKAAVNTCHIDGKDTDAWFDLCQKCADEIMKYLGDPAKETVEPQRSAKSRIRKTLGLDKKD